MEQETRPTWEQIDRRVEELYGLDEAVRQDSLTLLWIDIASLLSDRQMGALGEFWLEDFAKFDPEKGKFSQFLRGRLKHREMDMRRDDLGMRRTTDQNGNRVWRSPASLDAPIGGEETDTTLGDQLAERPADDPFEAVYLDGAACQLITAMLGMADHLTGQANNPRRREYFRLFFTDGVSNALRTQAAAPDAFQGYERDLFQALKETFLDFFLTEPCRTVSALAMSETRPYGEVVEGKPMEPLDQPLPNDVYMTYLLQTEGEKVGASALSQQKAAYRDYLRKALC